jgi:SAM-dependent methyltransferase
MPNPFATPSMAEGYARARPPLHGRIVDRVRALLAPSGRVAAALDIGCGSGLSTRPLTSLADRVLGIDPNPQMLSWARSVAPGARFTAARAEALPLGASTVDLITAAGSLNYTDPPAVFREAARILTRSGAMCVYDFGQGRSALLEGWFAELERRYPMPRSEAIPLDPEILAGMNAGFRTIAADRFEMAVPMDAEKYANYIMTEANIAAAIRRGEVEYGIREWLRQSLAPIFDAREHEVVFKGYVVVQTHT